MKQNKSFASNMRLLIAPLLVLSMTLVLGVDVPEERLSEEECSEARGCFWAGTICMCDVHMGNVDDVDGIGDGDAGSVLPSISDEQCLEAKCNWDFNLCFCDVRMGNDVDGIGDGDAGDVLPRIDVEEDAIVEGTVWAKGGVSAKNVKVKLFRRDPVKAVATTKTAADGSYKFVVKGANDFMGGKFYIKVILPKGREFTTSKKRRSNVNRKTGRSKSFRIKPGEPVIRNAYIRKPKPPPTRLMKGLLFEDLNGNGKQDGNEPSIPNFDLKIPTDISGNFVSVTTDNNGQYEVAVPTSLPRQGPTVIEIGPDACSIQVCAEVFENPNGNFCKDPGEAGIPNVDVYFTECWTEIPNKSFCIVYSAISTNSNGSACLLVKANALYQGPTKVVVDIDDTTIIPPFKFQNLGTDPTTHLIEACKTYPYTTWDVNGFVI